MREIIAADKPLRREVWSREQLIDKWRRTGESFKAEWAAELPEGEELTVYWSGDDWLDMCRGPHLPSTGKLDPQAFKLMRVSGAYWRGDQKNAMLTRIYGTGWLNKKQLDAHLHAAGRSRQARPPQARARDGPVPPAGRSAWQRLLASQAAITSGASWRPTCAAAIDAAGYQEVKTPQVMDARQWEQSGHCLVGKKLIAGMARSNMCIILIIHTHSDCHANQHSHR